MRINDILVEEERLDEKPMGFLSKMGNKAAAAFGSDAAKGRLESGEFANWLKKQFMTYLGKSRQKAEPEVVLQWLKQQGYPTQGAKAAMSAPTGAEKVGKAAGAVAKGLGKAGKAVAGATKALAKGAAEIGGAAVAGAKAGAAAQQPAQGPQADAQKPAQNNTQAPANVQKPAQKAAPAPQAAKPTAPTPSAAQPTTAKPAPAQGGVKIAGAKKKPAPNMQVASVQFESSMEALFEELTGSQLDKVFLAAVADKERVDAGGQKLDTGSDTPDNVGKGGLGGVAKGFKAGAASQQVDKNKDGKDDATGEPMQPDAAAKPAAPQLKQGQQIQFKSAKDGSIKTAYVSDPNKAPNGDAESIAVVNNPKQGASQAYPIKKSAIVPPEKASAGTGSAAQQPAPTGEQPAAGGEQTAQEPAGDTQTPASGGDERLQQKIQDAKATAARKKGSGLTPQEEKDIEKQVTASHNANEVKTIPADIKQQLNQLTMAQKQELLKVLK